MKFIHTSDWHLGKRLHQWDRTDEQLRFLEQLRDLAAAEKPDALVVAGDVFDGASPGSETGKMFVEGLLAIQEASPGMVAAVIAGNHDSCARLVVDEALWAHHGVRVVGRPAEDETGTARYGDNLVEVPGKGWIAAVPYCAPRNFPAPPDGNAGADRDRQSAYFAGLRAAAEAASGGRLPVVLAAHLAVGRETDFTGQDRGAVIGGEECADPGSLGADWDYVALGHIHCPQFVKNGAKRIRYCGTPMAMDFDEERHPHGADVVEIAARGSPPSVRSVRFEPLRTLTTLGGEAGEKFEALLDRLPRAGLPPGTYVRLRTALAPGQGPGPDWGDRARAAAEAASLRHCRIVAVRPETPDAPKPDATFSPDELRDLTDERVVDILAAAKALTDSEVELLRSVLETLDRDPSPVDDGSFGDIP